jgi:hypothetical protein
VTGQDKTIHVHVNKKMWRATGDKQRIHRTDRLHPHGIANRARERVLVCVCLSKSEMYASIQ